MRVPKIYYAFRGHGFSLLGRKTLPAGSSDAQDVLAQTLPQDVAYLVCGPFLLFPQESPYIFYTFVIKDRKSTRLNSSHVASSYAVFCLKKKNKTIINCIFPMSTMT